MALLTKSAYDGLDRLTSTILPSGLTTSYTYATSPNLWANNVATVTRSASSGPLSPTVTTYAYEPSFNKEVSSTDALGRVTTMTYDPWTGNLLSKTADAGTAPHFNARTSFTYNAVGLLTSTTDPVGTVTRHVYDDFGNRLITVADAVPGGLNLTTTYAYDGRGDPVSVTDPRGNKTTNRYDDARRLIATTTPGTSSLPGGVTTTYTYDADGRVDEALGRRAIVRLTAAQEEGKKTALSICQCVDLRIAPAS